MRAYHHGHLRSALMEAAIAALTAGEEPSLRELARRVGVAPSAVYHHFADKDALIAAVATEGFATLGAAQRALTAEDPRERLVALGMGYVRFAVEHPGQFGVMFRAELKDAARYPALAAAADETFAVLLDATTALDPSASPERALALWAMAHGLAELVRRGPLVAKLGERWPAFVETTLRREVGG